MTKDMINGWLERNDEAMDRAADWLAEGLIETFICKMEDLKDEAMLRNATDLADCDEYDIEVFFSLLNRKYELSRDYDYTYGTLDSQPFSIKEWNRKEKGFGGVRCVFSEWCDDHYQEVLPEDLLSAVRERHDVGCIVNAYAYGGGGYEVIQDLFLAARKKLTETIKKQILN
jgi:hypothetical protein